MEDSSATASRSGLVDRARIRRDLIDLIRIPSVTGDERAVQEFVARRLHAIGAVVERIETDPVEFASDPDWPGSEVERSELPVVVGRLGRPGGRRLLLVGHVDVVPVGDSAAWSVPPWDGNERDGAIYGRGAVDMKGGVAAILEAMRVLAAGPALEDEVLAVFVPSEEDGGAGMLAAIRAGCTGDAAVITEPTDLALVIAHAGAITFRLTVLGRAAHASIRKHGISALDKLQRLITALESDEAARNSAETDPLMTALGLPYPTIIGTVAGGTWASTVMDRVVAEGRYGVRLGQTWSEAEVELRTCIERAAAADPWLAEHPPLVEVTGGRFSSARIAPEDPLVIELADAAERVLGRRPDLLGAPYGADMRLLVREGNTPTVMFGPGPMSTAHAADEHVRLDEVTATSQVLVDWVERAVGRSA